MISYDFPKTCIDFWRIFLKITWELQKISKCYLSAQEHTTHSITPARARAQTSWPLLHQHTCTIHYYKFEDLLVQYLLKIVELFIAIILISQVRAFLKPPMLGVVLQTYGCGNAPNNRDDLITEIKKATRRDVLIINCTQCLHGPVVDQYATGKVNLRNWHNHA